MGKTYDVGDDQNLNFEIVSPDLKFITTPGRDFKIVRQELLFKTNSDFLSFKIVESIDEHPDEDRILSFEITSDNLDFINISTFLPTVLITSANLYYINNSIYLAFNINDFDGIIPELTIVLEFFNETGGVF